MREREFCATQGRQVPESRQKCTPKAEQDRTQKQRYRQWRAETGQLGHEAGLVGRVDPRSGVGRG